MLDNFADNLALRRDVGAQLLGQGHLFVIAIVAIEQEQVEARGFARDDLGVHAVLAQVDLGTVDLVHENGGQSALYLQRKVWALDDIDGRDERVNHERETWRIVNGNGVGFSVDNDGRLDTATDDNRL